MCTPSNSMRILRFEYAASTVKCLRYQLVPPCIVPPPLWLFTNVSVSFHVLGMPTCAQLESSYEGACAPLGSMPTRVSQGVAPMLISTRFDAGKPPASLPGMIGPSICEVMASGMASAGGVVASDVGPPSSPAVVSFDPWLPFVPQLQTA